MIEDDVVIVGAGLAGLAATLELQSAGRRVRLLEARDRAGGLCSTEEWNGLEYTIACNDFAGGLVTRCRDAGVAQEFREVCARFVIGPNSAPRDYALPPRVRSSGAWLRRAPELARLALALRGEARSQAPPVTLGHVLDRVHASARLRELCGILGYAYGMSASEIAVDALLAELSPTLGYGTGRSFVPTGGPQRLANALVDRARALGARIEFDTRVKEIVRDAEGFGIECETGSFRARRVLSSWVPNEESSPANHSPGLAPYTLRLRLGPDARLPADLHTLARLPGPTESFIPVLRRGEFPEAFGFHFFPCETPTRDGARAANLLFFAPAGAPAATQPRKRVLVDACFEGLDRLLPGLPRAIEAWDLVEPARIEARSGLSLSVIPHVRQPGEKKPTSLDPDSGLARIGTRFGPPGDHAGAAWQSGVWGARAVLGA